MSKISEGSIDQSIFLYEDLPEELYFFAYGANMNPLQIKERCRNAEVVTVASLPGYRMDFFGYSRFWDGAQESLVADPLHRIWGVVYELSTMDLERLDAWQDVRMDGTGLYFHYPVRVVGEDGHVYIALLYEKDILGEKQLPSAPYRDFIVAGAEAQGLPDEYIHELRQLSAKQATYKVPRARLFNPESLLTWDCSSCEG